MATRKKATTKKPATKRTTKKAEKKTISVANLCRANDIDPKRGRQKLRNEGWSAQSEKGKQYPALEIGSKRYVEACEILGIE